MKIFDSACTSLKAIGKDEHWVREWIIEKPSRLGLGDIEIQRHDLIPHENRGGHLDILAYQAATDTYYEIEILLDDCDADHGLRTLAKWSRERLSHPCSRHIAVLVSEDLSGRYRPLLEGLPQIVPFIGIEIRVLTLPLEAAVATILTTVIAQSPGLEMDLCRLPLLKQKASSPRSPWRTRRIPP